MTIFPITKKYDGNKKGIKDYFYTMNFLKRIGIDKPIGGEEKVMEFLWEYESEDTKFYLASILKLLDEVRHYDGKPSILKEVMQEHGEATYTTFKDGGKTYRMNDETGSIERVRKPRPRYLKLL